MIVRHQFAGRRGWIFTRRYYSPHGWRIPLLVWKRMGYGRKALFQTSHLRSFLAGRLDQ